MNVVWRSINIIEWDDKAYKRNENVMIVLLFLRAIVHSYEALYGLSRQVAESTYTEDNELQI